MNIDTTIRLTDNTEHVNKMIKAIKDNDGYCPCTLEKTEDTLCLCKEFMEMDSGVCKCGLYVKESFGI